MYTLLKAFKHHSRIRNKWVEVDDLNALLNTNVEQVNNLFGRVQLILVHNSEPSKHLRYDFVQQRKQFQPPPPTTLLQWLTLAAGINLNTTEFKGLGLNRAFYADCLNAGFKLETTYPAGIPNMTQTDEMRTDVFIEVPSRLTPEVVLSNCLFTVAGYLHMPYANANGVYLRDGGTTLNRSNINTCGVISFNTLGGVKAIGITPEMLSALPEHGEMNKRVKRPIYIKVDNFNPMTQTAFLSLMGVIIPMGKTFREVGDGLFEVNLVQYDYLSLFMRAERILGFKDVKKKIEQNPKALTQLSLYDVASRDFLEGILTCSQSFIFVVNSPGVYWEKIQLETTQNSMAFLSQQPVKGPVVDGEGVMIDYLQNRELDAWVLDTPPTDQINRRVMVGATYNEEAVDSLPQHDNQMRRTRAYEVILGATVFK